MLEPEGSGFGKGGPGIGCFFVVGTLNTQSRADGTKLCTSFASRCEQYIPGLNVASSSTAFTQAATYSLCFGGNGMPFSKSKKTNVFGGNPAPFSRPIASLPSILPCALVTIWLPFPIVCCPT